MQIKSYSLELKKKIKPFNKSIKVDSDKSLSIRSFLIGSICQDISIIKNALESEDVQSSIQSLRKLGVLIKKTNSQTYKVHGKGLGSLYAKKNLSLNFGNSGTLARLLIGILSMYLKRYYPSDMVFILFLLYIKVTLKVVKKKLRLLRI